MLKKQLNNNAKKLKCAACIKHTKQAVIFLTKDPLFRLDKVPVNFCFELQLGLLIIYIKFSFCFSLQC